MRLGRVTGHTIKVNKADLLSAPDLERLFFVLLGHFSNEVVILNKLLLALSNRPKDEPAHEMAFATQATFLSKLLLSKLFEGWLKLFQQIFFGKRLGMEYEPQLSERGRGALADLKRFFGTTKYVAGVRNSFFHYPDDTLLAALPDIPEDEEWNLYLSKEHGNSLYYASEVVVSHALLAGINPENKFDAMVKLMADCNFLTNRFLALLGDCMYIFAERHLHLGSLDSYPTFDISAPHLQDVQFPYFADSSEYDPLSEEAGVKPS